MVSGRQWLAAASALIVAYAFMAYQNGGSLPWKTKSKRVRRWDHNVEGSAALGVYIDQQDHVVVSQARGKGDARVILKGKLLKSEQDGTIVVDPVASNSAEFVHFWKRIDDGTTVEAVFKTLSKELDDSSVRSCRYMGFALPVGLALSTERRDAISNYSSSTGLGQKVFFYELHEAIFNIHDIPYRRDEGPVTKFAIVSPDNTYVTVDDGKAIVHTTPFSLLEFLENKADPPFNYEQLIYVHPIEIDRHNGMGLVNASEREDPRTPPIFHAPFDSIASGSACLVGTHIDTMAFNTYVRIARPIKISVGGSRGAAQVLMGADDKQGALTLEHESLPAKASSLDIQVLRGEEGESTLVKLSFDQLPAGSVAVVGSASWRREEGVEFVFQAVDLSTGTREYKTHISGWTS